MFEWKVFLLISVFVLDSFGNVNNSTDPEVNWKVLGSYSSGELSLADLLLGQNIQKNKKSAKAKPPPDVLKSMGHLVKVSGYIIANEFGDGSLKEFLLTPVVGCIHVPPPPPNYVIHVEMADGKTVPYSTDPVWVHGTLKLVHAKTNYYEMIGQAVEPVK